MSSAAAGGTRERTRLPVLAAATALCVAMPAAAQRPSVTSASLSLVELTPGGQPVQLEIVGTSLDPFTAAQVESRGRALRGFQLKVTFDKARSQTIVVIAADASTPAMRAEIVLVSRDLRLPVPGVEISVLAAEEPGLARFYVDRTTVDEGEQVRISATLDRPAGGDGAEVLLTYPPSIDGPPSIHIAAGRQAASVLANVLDVSQDATTQIIGQLGDDKSIIAVTVIDNSFYPQTFAVGPFTIVGVRFAPQTFSVSPFAMVGVRFEPQTFSVSTLTFSGFNFEPQAFSVSPLTIQGVRFEPQTITTPTLTVVGIGESN